MKKILSIVCLALTCAFCLIGCSAQKNVDKLLASQTSFKEEQAENLDTTKTIFSAELEADYNSKKSADQKLELRTLETLIQTSNLTLTKLKVYLENKDVVKKLDDGDVKKLINLENEYYTEFKNLIDMKNKLQKTIDNGSSNLKYDYDNLNKQIEKVLVCSANSSKKLTDMLKNVYKIKITDDQTVLNVGELEILTLEVSSNLVYIFSKIYIEQTGLTSFGVLTPNMNLNEVLLLLNGFSSDKYDLTDEQFASLKDKILTMQNLNNNLLSKLDYFNDVNNSFNLETLKENAKTAFPNEENTESRVIAFVSSDKIDALTQAQFNFIAGLISNNIVPAISNLLSLCNEINSL